jgi:RIP metalloprotease RseP
LISINLAILNLLPLPALDGGHIAFLILEGIRGKRLPKGLEDRVMQTGLVLLLGLGVVLIFKDTIAIVTGSG